jgi:hypothetical protein
VDPEAEILFVPPIEVPDVVEQQCAISFDVSGSELGHAEGRCSFESILHKYHLSQDPGLARLARIVHAADVASDINMCPEGAGLKAIATGFLLLHQADDRRKLELQAPVYDALYAWCRDRG